MKKESADFALCSASRPSWDHQGTSQSFRIGSAQKGHPGNGNPGQKLAGRTAQLLQAAEAARPGSQGHFLPTSTPGRWSWYEGSLRGWVTAQLCSRGETPKAVYLQEVGKPASLRVPAPSFPRTGASRRRALGSGHGAWEGVWRTRAVQGPCPEAQPAWPTFLPDRSGSCEVGKARGEASPHSVQPGGGTGRGGRGAGLSSPARE